MKQTTMATIALAIAWPFCCMAPAIAADSIRREAHVSWVIDGDTFELDTKERIRLIGVDAPEYSPWRNKVHYYGKEAAFYLKQLLDDKKVTLEQDVEAKDRYGRALAYVYLDGLFVNLHLAQEGYAKAKNYPPNVKYQAELKNAANQAKEARRGLWNKRDKPLVKHVS